jgi:hypothetical protein
MISVLLTGIAVAAGGLLLDSEPIVTVGVILAGFSALGFLVPGLRDVRPADRVDRESYFGFVADLFRTTGEPSLRTSRGDRDKGPPSARDHSSSHPESDSRSGSP